MIAFTSVKLNIRGIALDDESKMPICLLQDDENRLVLPVEIGPFEASSIIVEREGITPPRPLTHDLIVSLFRTHNIKMMYLDIYTANNDKYLARLVYKKGLRKYQMEVRPSDGIALALRCKAPIYTSTSVLESRYKDTSYLEKLDPYNPEVLYLDKEGPNPPLM